MTWHALVDPAFSGRLCLTLLHSVWQVALAALIVWCVDRLWRSCSVERRYAVSVAALVTCLAVMPITYALLDVVERPSDTAIATPTLTTVVESEPTSIANGPVEVELVAGVEIQTIDPPSEIAGQMGASTADDASPVESSPWWLLLAPWIVALYTMGVVLMLARLGMAILRANRLGAHAHIVTDGPLVETLRSLADNWSMRVVPALARAGQIVVPKVVGLARPTILLPAAAISGLSTDELEMILTHELAHVRRYDMWVNLVQRLAEAVLFFNPALWYLSRKIGTLREYCCDEMTCSVQSASAPEPRVRYATALLRVVELAKPNATTTSDLASLAASGRSPSEIRRRVARLFGEPLREPLRLSRGGVLALALVAAMLMMGPAVWQSAANSTAARLADSVEDEAAIDDVNSRSTEPPADPVIAKEPLPTLKVRAVDKRGEPIADARVLCYDGNHFMAGMPVDFKQISKPTDEDGWADLGTLPQDRVRVQVNGRKDAFSTSDCYIYEGEEGFALTGSHPQITIESDDQTVTLVFTMRKHVDLDFEIIDSESGEAVYWPTIYYRDEQQKPWWTLSLIDDGGQHNFSTIFEEMNDSRFRVAAVGYYPVEFRLDEKLKVGKQATQRVEMKPAPEVRFTVLTADGKPVEGAKVNWISPKELGNINERRTVSDAQGMVRKPYPAQGELARFEITHESGRAVVEVKDLPEPTTVTEDGERKDVILCEVRLSPADPRGIEPAWGKAADGVRVRLTKVTAHWRRSDRPLPGLRLFYDVKNEGSRSLELLGNGRRHQVEVDGRWYEWVDPQFTGRDRDGPTDTRLSILLDFEPGSSHEDKRVDVAGNWLPIPKERDIVKAIQARYAMGIGFVYFKDHRPELVLSPGKHRVRVAVNCRVGATGIVRAISEAVEVEIVQPEAKETIERENIAAGRPRIARPMANDSRQRFLEIERLARLPMDEQANELSRLYKDLAPRYMNMRVEGLISSYRENILDGSNFDGPGGDHTTRWTQQLADAASEMTPEEVAEKLEIGLWWNVAARARAIQVFKNHPKATPALIEADLDTKQKGPVERAAGTILSVELLEYTDRLLTAFLRDDETSK